MLNRTVKLGLKYIIVGLSLIFITALFHFEPSGLLSPTVTGEASLLFLGVPAGGIIGGTGVLISIFGFLCKSGSNNSIGAMPVILTLFGLAGIMIIIFISITHGESIYNVKPGVTISI